MAGATLAPITEQRLDPDGTFDGRGIVHQDKTPEGTCGVLLVDDSIESGTGAWAATI